MAAITQIRHKHSQGRAYYDKKISEGKTHKEALRSLKRRISDAIYAALVTDARHAAAACPRAREGNRGTTLSPGRPAHTPHTSSSDKPLPGLPPPYGPPPPQAPSQLNPTERFAAGLRTPQPLRRNPAQPLDSNSKEDSFCSAGSSSAIIFETAQIRPFCAQTSPGSAEERALLERMLMRSIAYSLLH